MKFLILLILTISLAFAAKPVKKSKQSKDILAGIEFSYFFSNEKVSTSEVVWFACRNIVNNRYLVNNDRTKFCWIRNPAEFAEIFKGLGIKYEREKTMAGKDCPPEFEAPEYCDPKKLRDF